MARCKVVPLKHSEIEWLLMVIEKHPGKFVRKGRLVSKLTVAKNTRLKNG